MLPAVASTMCPPGFSRPSFSAASIMDTAIRSLIELPGFSDSIFTKRRHGPVSRCLSSSIGVLPIISRTLPKTGARCCMGAVYGRADPSRRGRTRPCDGNRQLIRVNWSSRSTSAFWNCVGRRIAPVPVRALIWVRWLPRDSAGCHSSAAWVSGFEPWPMPPPDSLAMRGSWRLQDFRSPPSSALPWWRGWCATVLRARQTIHALIKPYLRASTSLRAMPPRCLAIDHLTPSLLTQCSHRK